MRSFVLAFIIVGLLISAQPKAAWADIIDTSNPVNIQVNGTIAVSASAGGSQTAEPYSFSGPYTWSFTPSSLSFEGASASQSVNVTYTGSSLTATGTGASSGANPNLAPPAQPSSTFSISITPDTNVSYQLSGDLLGDIVDSGNGNSGAVHFTQFAPGLWSYILDPTYTPTTFDLSGTMYAGDQYVFGIGVYPGAPYAPADTYQGSWDFSLSAGSPEDLTATPEPGSLILLASGLAGMAASWRRKRNSRN
jgi:hypothetical protein